MATDTIEARLLRKREAAVILAVSERMIDAMLAKRELTPLKFGRCVRIDRLEIEARIAAARR